MTRKMLVTAVLLMAVARWGYAAAGTCGSSSGSTGPVLNGFEGTPDTDTNCSPGEIGDIADWTVTGTAPLATLVAAGTGYPVVEGQDFGYASWAPAVTNATFTLPSADFSANDAWDNYNYIFVAYATESTTAAPNFSLEYKFTNGVPASATFVQPGGMIASATYASATNYTYAITSLNYVRNLGYSTTAISQLALANFATTGAPMGVAYDDLQLDPIVSTIDTPNPAVPAVDISGTPGCDSFALTWAAQTRTGTDAITGYHIYRGASATGPWTSLAYVPGAASTSYSDGTASGTTVYYIVLPYSSTTTAFGPGATGYFTRCNSGLDPATQAAIGVNEAALGATAAGPFNAQAGCSPTETPSYSPSPTDTFTRTLTYSLTPTYSITPTETPSPTYSSTSTVTFTSLPTDTPIPGATNTLAPTNTPGPPGPTATYTPTYTQTVFVTPTPIETQVSVVLWPNPFYPDRGQIFHVGPVPASSAWTVFDIVGKFVYKSGGGQDDWTGYNANGIEVTTGIYFLVLDGHVYRLAVVRN